MVLNLLSKLREFLNVPSKISRKKPLKDIPSNLLNLYLMDGKIRLKYSYRNDSYPSFFPKIYIKPQINHYLKQARDKEPFYYGETSRSIYKALEKYSIKDKQVAIIGSVSPKCESICLFYGGKPTVIEYNKIISLDPRLKVMTVTEFDKKPMRFQAAFSISSFEHDGLGRYGDPLNPDGDLEAMEKMKKVIEPKGLLFLATHIGNDACVWNSHRIYGRTRLPLLLKGWNFLDVFGLDESFFDRTDFAYIQPVFVLQNK